MAAQSPSELLQWLADNQFLPLPQAEEIRALLPTLPTSLALIKDLLHRNWLTPFQANQIMAGKHSILVLGPYRLLERLGEGAMGQVFKAWNVCLGRFAAVKMLHISHMTNTKAMDRFRQEMAATGHLKHANIVLVRDAGEIDDRPYMVMDYCEGTNLSQVVKAQGPLPIYLACDYIRQAALGLQHASDKGVVHRDIKPSNLMLTTAGPEGPGVVKILDFGLARLQTNPSSGRLTQIGNIIGTIDYIAPEQVENAQKADVRSDIYSLGGTLFFLLVGRPPFTGSTMVEKVSGRLVGELPQLKQARPDVPAELEAVLARMMALRPADRYQKPVELAQALAPLCTPVGAAVPMARPVAAAPSSSQLARPVIPQASLAPPLPSVSPPPEAPPWESPAWAQPAASAAGNVAAAAEPFVDYQENANPFSFADTPVVGSAEGTMVSPAPPTPAPEVLTAVALEDLPAEPLGRRRPRPSSAAWKLPGTRKVWMIAGGGLFGFVVLIILMIMLIASFGPSGSRSADKSVNYPGGSLKLLPVSRIILRPGQSREIHVRVERRAFEGPVELRFAKLPEGVTAGKVVVEAEKVQAKMRIMASFAIPDAEVEAQIEASAGNLTFELPVSVTVMKSPLDVRN